MHSNLLNLVQEATATQMLCNISPGIIKNIQNTRLKKIFTYAKNNSIFYKNKFSNLTKHNLQFQDIAPITKQELMENFDYWITNQKISKSKLQSYASSNKDIGGLYQNEYLLFESSGTTGAPGLFLHDLNSIAVYQALESTRRATSTIINQMYALAFQYEKIAFIGALNGHYASTAAIKFNQRCFPILNSIVQQVSIYEKNDDLIKILNRYSPRIIATYPSLAITLAELQKRGELTIAPKEIWLGGETLDCNQKKYIETNLNTRVFNSYGASEFPPIAWECDYGKLHVNADWVILEGVDNNFNPTPIGEFSRTCLITNLVNTIQPFIRYELGDQIKFHQSLCACGNTLPTIEVRGRNSEVFVLKDQLGAQITIPSIDLTTFLEEHGLYNFCIDQDSNLDLNIRIPSEKIHIFQSLIKTIDNFFIHRDIIPPKMKIIESRKSIKKNHSGKLHNFLINKFSNS